VDWRLSQHFTGHDVQTVRRRGWSQLKNGALLRQANGQFHVFVTVDQNLSFQQDLSGLSFAVVVLRARSVKLADLVLLVPRLLAILPSLRPGTVTVIESA
jgi:hypothetical protein